MRISSEENVPNHGTLLEPRWRAVAPDFDVAPTLGEIGVGIVDFFAGARRVNQHPPPEDTRLLVKAGDLVLPTLVSPSPHGSVQIRNSGVQKALGALDSRDSLRSSVALLPVVLASSGFAESASPFQSARILLIARQKRTGSPVLI